MALFNSFTRLEEDGTILFFGMQDFTTDIINSQRKLFRYELIWEKEKGTQFFESENRPLPNHENILVFSLKYPQLYNPIKHEGKPYRKKKNTQKQGTNYQKDSQAQIITKNQGDRYPLSILYFPRDKNQKDSFHPTQKPKELMQFLIDSYSNKQDYIVDICAGSFSTLMACLMEERNSINSELDKEIFALSSKRLQYFLIHKKDAFKKPRKMAKTQQHLDIFTHRST